MKVLYDHQMFSRQKYGGITKYFCELIKNYPNEHNYSLSLLFSENQHLKENFKFFRKSYFPMPKNESRVKGFLKKKSYAINNSYSKWFISQNKYDLFHPTYFDPYFLKLLKKPYIITVHDLIAFKYQDLYKNNIQIAEMTEVICKANRIIAISENTKKDIIDILMINPDKIDVIYHGFNPAQIEKRNNPNGRYILYVGTRWGYKNFINLAKSFSELIREDKELKLICVGPPFTKKETEKLFNLNIDKNTRAIEVNENELNHLYTNALCFIYPTLYEGFGMPILESFANNCPICLSNTSSLPEIAGDAGTYFNPLDPESISKAIKSIIYNAEYSKKMVEAGNLQLNHFSWKKCAEQTLNSYERALS